MTDSPINITVEGPEGSPEATASTFGQLFKALVPAIEGGVTAVRLLGQQVYCTLGTVHEGVPHRISGLVIDFPVDPGGEATGTLLGGYDHGSYRQGEGRRVLLPLMEAITPEVARRSVMGLTQFFPSGSRISYERFEQPTGDAEALAPSLSAQGVRLNVRALLASAARHALASHAPNVSMYSNAAFDRLLRRAEKREAPVPLPWRSLNEKLGGGLWPGLYILVGGTGDGKTQMALQMGVCAARHRFPVLYISLELGKTDITARLSGLLTGQMWSDLYLGKDREQITRAREKTEPILAGLPLHTEFGESYGWSYKNLRERCEQLVAAYEHLLRDADGNPMGPPLIILDFLQIVDSPEGARIESMRERIMKASYAGRAVARDLDAAVLLISSAARSSYEKMGEGRFLPSPNGQGLGAEVPPITFVDVGKESGEIEYGADGAMSLVTEKRLARPRIQCPEGMTPVHIALAKGRAVRPGWVTLGFDGCMFHDLMVTTEATSQVASGPQPPVDLPANPLDLSVG